MKILIILTSIILIISVIGLAVYIYEKYKIKPLKTNTVTDEFIETPTPPGFYLIIGPQGSGKTSLMMALLDTDSTYHGDYRINLAKEEIKKLNSIKQDDPYKLKCPPIAYRTRTKFILSSNNKPTLHTDIAQFGLPEGQKDVQYFPVGTYIACDEIDSFMDCRKWQEDKQYIIDGFKYIRHNSLVFFGDAQNFEKCDIDIRRLATDVFYIHHKKDIYERVKWYSRKKTLTKTEWIFTWVKPQQLANESKLRALGVNIPDTHARKCKFIYNGNIYQRYNSLSGKPYWLQGINNYTVEEHPKNNYTRDGVNSFCNQNSLRFEEKNKKDK